MAEAVIEGGRSPSALSGLGALAPWRQIALLLGLAGSVALGGSIAMWSQTPSYALLYGSLGAQDAAEVVTSLEAAGIPIRLDHRTGAVLVPSERVHEARLELAGQGLPRSTDQGFEMMEAKQGFGTSQFVERARYQRALEVELARTISNLNNVQGARVHLAVPRETAFLRNRLPPSASVLLQLRPGRSLEDGQADAVAHLVAAAIPSLEPGQVRVVNERGQLLTRPRAADGVAASAEQLDYTRRVEQTYVQRIENILAPVVGADALQAEVTADVDFTRIEQSRESFDPDLAALRSERVLEESAAGAEGLGIPGALSNQPPAATQVPEVAEGPGVEQPGAAAGTSRRSSTRNFELDRVVSHTRQPGAVVRRLSVAVVVDDVRAAAADGTLVTRPRTPEEIERMTALVREAVGFDTARGDTVNVVNAAFTMPALPEALPDQPLWEQPWVWTLGRQVGGGLLVLVLAFGVLRPLMRNLVARDAAEREAEAASQRLRLAAEQEQEGEGEERLSLSSRRASGTDVDSVRRLAQQDPKRVANVVRNWVEANG